MARRPVACADVYVTRAPTSMRRLPLLNVARRLPTLAVGFTLLAVPALLHAQQTDSVARAATEAKPGTVLHTVRPGDTLFDIARRYLGNPFRWPELFRANSRLIANADLIYPGQRLYVGADGRPTFTPDGVDASDAPEETTGRAVPLGRNPAGQAVSMLANATISGRTLRPTVRRGEALAAPVLVSARTPQVGGSLVSRADPTIVAGAMSRDQFQLFDEVNVLLPVGMKGEVGQEYSIVRVGPEVRRGNRRTRVVQPTGVVEIVALGTGRAARARVSAQFANLRRGDLLIARDTVAVPTTVRPQQIGDGPIYEVAWVDGDVVLPTIQKYVVITMPAGAVSKPGDEYELYADGEALTKGRTDIAPASDVARVSVVRVSAEGATAVVIGHAEPAIRVGMRARLVARMP